MKVKNPINKIRKKVKLWRKRDKRKAPDVFIHFFGGKENPYQGNVKLVKGISRNKGIEYIETFHSSAELMMILKVILDEYPMVGSKKITESIE